MEMKTVKGGESVEKRKRSCCAICLACLVAFLVVIGIFVAATALFIHLYLSNGSSEGANQTMVGEEKKWYEEWEAPIEIREKMPHKFLGFDKHNRPVWFADFGKWDLSGILKDEENVEIMEKIAEQSIYRVNQSMRMRSTPENPIRTWVLIVDMNEYSLWQATDLTVVRFLQDMSTRHMAFLKTMDYGFIINMGSLARGLIYAMRPFVGNVLERIETLGYDEDEWRPLILAQISADQLPHIYGGHENFTAVATYR